jgi:hypothetical protein
MTEFLLGAGVIGSSILNPGYTGIFIFIGLGLFLSPFVSWIGERRPVYTTPGIENFTKQEPPVPLTS